MEVLPFLTHLSTQDTLQPLLKTAFNHVIKVLLLFTINFEYHL